MHWNSNPTSIIIHTYVYRYIPTNWRVHTHIRMYLHKCVCKLICVNIIDTDRNTHSTYVCTHVSIFTYICSLFHDAAFIPIPVGHVRGEKSVSDCECTLVYIIRTYMYMCMYSTHHTMCLVCTYHTYDMYPS